MTSIARLATKLQDYSLKKKLIVLTMFVTLVTLLLALSAIIALDRNLTKQQMVEEITALSQVLAKRTEVALSFGDKRSAQGNIDSLESSQDYVLGCVYGSNDELYAQFHMSSTTTKCPSKPPSAAEFLQFEPVTSRFIHLWTPVIRNQDTVLGHLYVQRSLRSLNHRVTQFTLTSAAISVVVLIIGALIIARLQRLISTPILELSAIASKIAQENDYQHRASMTSKDEVGKLGAAFNLMLDTIEKTQADLRFMAFYDALTGLPNRRYFMETLERSMTAVQRGHRSLALLLIDLDGFKSVNDTIGHDAGDLVLEVVSKRMQALLRKSDMVARLGGDEFTIILSDIASPAAIRKIALTLIRTIEEPILFRGQNADVSASVGIALAPRETTSMDELLKQADAAMYRAKGAGKKTFYFHDEAVDAQMKLEFSQEEHLEKTLLNETVQLLYQPILQLDQSIMQGLIVTLAPQGYAQEKHANNAQNTSTPKPDQIPSKIRHISNPKTANLMLERMLCQLEADVFLKPSALAQRQNIALVLTVTNAQLRDEPTKTLVKELAGKLSAQKITLKLAVDRAGFDNQIDPTLGTLLALSDDGDGIENLKGMSEAKSWCLATLTSGTPNKWTQLAWNHLTEAAQNYDTPLIGIGIHTQDQLMFAKELELKLVSGNLISPPLLYSELFDWLTQNPEIKS